MTTRPALVQAPAARRLLQTVGVVDLVCGCACIAFSAAFGDRLGLSGRSSVLALGILLIPLGIAGLAAARTKEAALGERLRLQAVLNLGYAIVVVVVMFAGSPSVGGFVVLGVIALAVAALAVLQFRLGAGVEGH